MPHRCLGVRCLLSLVSLLSHWTTPLGEGGTRGVGVGRTEGERERKARGKEEIHAAVGETLDKTNMK